MYVAFEIASAVYDIILMVVFLKGLYHTYKVKPLIIFTIYLIGGMGFCLLKLVHVDALLRDLYMIAAIMIVAKILFGADLLSAFYNAVLIVAISFVVQNMCGSFMILAGVPSDLIYNYSQSNYRLLFNLSHNIILTAFVYYYVKLSQWKKTNESLADAAPLLICLVFVIFISYVIGQEKLTTGPNLTVGPMIGVFGVIYICIIVFLFVERVKKISEIRKQNALAEEQYATRFEYFEQVKTAQEETHALWHDIKKYVNTMNDLINQNDFDHAKECIDYVNELFGNITYAVDVGNIVVSALLNHSVQKARRFEIETELDIKVQPDLNISAADLGVIISSTFDHAIGACGRLSKDKRRISVKMTQENLVLLYEIRNQCIQERTMKAGRIIQGIDMKNVRRCVDKYNGTMGIDASENEFTVTVQLNIPLKSAKALLAT